MNKKPQFKHDCKNCSFLGNYEQADLYFCEQGGTHPTIIARFSDEGGDYISGMEFRHTNKILSTAYDLAKNKNLV